MQSQVVAEWLGYCSYSAGVFAVPLVRSRNNTCWTGTTIVPLPFRLSLSGVISSSRSASETSVNRVERRYLEPAMTRIRWMPAAGLLLASLLITSCKGELAPSAVVALRLQQATPWPDTLATGEIATMFANVRAADGADIVGVDLQWSSSDSSVL